MNSLDMNDEKAFETLIELSQKTINLILKKLDASGISPNELTLNKLMQQDVLKDPLYYLGAATFGLYIMEQVKLTNGNKKFTGDVH